jgi:hypothetical protein
MDAGADLAQHAGLLVDQTPKPVRSSDNGGGALMPPPITAMMPESHLFAPAGTEPLTALILPGGGGL